MRLQYADWGFANPLNKIRGNPNMGAIFTSPGRTVIAGIVLLIIIVVVVGLVTGQMTHIAHAWANFAMRWLHVISGILWIGLLWYLNFVQVPTMPTIQPVESRVAITKFIAPNVLFYFRYAALATVMTGLRHDRHRHVDGAHHGVQRVVHHLAEPAEDPGTRRSDGRAEGRGRQARSLCQPLQHHVLDRHALLHGGAAERADLIRSIAVKETGPRGAPFSLAPSLPNEVGEGARKGRGGPRFPPRPMTPPSASWTPPQRSCCGVDTSSFHLPPPSYGGGGPQ